MIEGKFSSPIREAILFTGDATLPDLVRQSIVHWPIDVHVRREWLGWKDLPEECRLIMIDRSTIPPFLIDNPSFRIILSGNPDDLLRALGEFLFLREPLAQAVGIEDLLSAKCRQYLRAMSALKEPESAYPFFCDLLDRMLIPTVLEVTDGNQHKASRILGISRTTFRNKMKTISGVTGPDEKK